MTDTLRPTTNAERREHVAQANANMKIEGFAPTLEDTLLQQRYINGDLTPVDLLREAHAFAAHAKANEK